MSQLVRDDTSQRIEAAKSSIIQHDGSVLSGRRIDLPFEMPDLANHSAQTSEPSALSVAGCRIKKMITGKQEPKNFLTPKSWGAVQCESSCRHL